MQSDNLQQHIFNARALLRQQHSGVLSTLSLSLKGYPFGSVTPYWMTEQGSLVLYASDIAQHSRNMQADAKVSLCVFDGAQDDSQANARVTVLGEAALLGKTCDEAQAYFQLYPQAEAYKQAHDFQFYRITPSRVRYIGGFGEIYWFKAEDWQYPTPAWQAQAGGMITHMHDDHADALALMLNLQHQQSANTGEVQMLNVLAEGFHVRYRDKTFFIRFDSACLTANSIRPAMVSLTQAARHSLQQASVA